MRVLKYSFGLLLLSLICLEVCLRFAGFARPLLYKASGAGYEFVPNQTINLLGKTTHINAIGARGPDVSAVPANGLYRILVIGDSVANGGTQINDEQTWPLQLERLLRKTGINAQVVNAASGGWAVQNEAAWLAEHGTLKARMIILEVNQKDLGQPFARSDILDNNVSFPTRYPLSALGGFVKRYVLPRVGLAPPSYDPGSTSGKFDPESFAMVLKAVDNIRTEAERHGAKFTILYWDVRDPPTTDVISARNVLFSYADRHNIQVFRPYLNKVGQGERFFRDQIHPNAEGNIEIAKVLRDNILQ
ncbi:GDSL-type esterase/lipase family protein [Sphingomonas sp. H39-1-10]|uniref:SGNH/GDSL hydrolase family protein n=1 Tax=Sphingomonas pollutisoli TaxID=3030829 RepID=UPI0023B886B8|nr:GDSL-type esterase/lipase family protein [Sphingomonas pollutisoli]MDF0490939.1 GDSL-type esterase/lipase family protein [Sphingomonas pollutisoli]